MTPSPPVAESVAAVFRHGTWCVSPRSESGVLPEVFGCGEIAGAGRNVCDETSVQRASEWLDDLYSVRHDATRSGANLRR